MRFSIITVCKNASETIRRTIDSVLTQTYTDYEYIIIDAASEDGTADIAYSYVNSQMKIISEPDKGISDAFNKGIKHSSGDVLFFLNSGDYFVSRDVLRNVAEDIERFKADIYTYSVTSMMNPQWPESKKAGEAYWEKSLIPHQGTFVKRNVFLEIDGFNENYKIRMDYDFFYRCRKAGKKFYCNPVVITHYDVNGISSTDKYNFKKEGLAVRLLYDSKVDECERETLDFLIGLKKNRESEYLERIRSQQQLIEKDHKIMVAMYQWLLHINRGEEPCKYFSRHGHQRVAIYGFGMLGKILKEGLLRSQTDVSYIVDQNMIVEDQPVLSWDDQWDPVDCIVVTPFYAYRDIKKRILQKKGNFNVISLEDILTEIEGTESLI